MTATASTSRPEPMRGPDCRTATRFSCNRNWNWRGDNAKPKAKK